MNNDDIQLLTVTVEQAAKLLGIGRSTAYELVHTGDIPSLRLGRRVVVPMALLSGLLGTPASRKLTHDRYPTPAPEKGAIASGGIPSSSVRAISPSRQADGGPR